MPLTISGGYSGGGTPLPIPNRAVKPASADGTRRATSRESRSPPTSLNKGPLRSGPLHSCRPKLVAPVGVELAQPADALGDRWMRHEQAGDALLCKGVERVEGLGRRVGAELDQLGGLLEADQRVREAVRGTAERRCGAVGLELSLRRE